MASEVMDIILEEDLQPLLHQLHSKHSSLCPEISVVLVLYKGDFSLQPTVTIT